MAILHRRTKKKHNRFITKVVVQWEHANPKDATWHELHEVQTKYSDFNLYRGLATRVVL